MVKLDDRLLLKKARLLDISERYKDMASVTKESIINCHENGLEITAQHRNYFSVAHKNLISSLRSSWRVLFHERQKLDETDQDDIDLTAEILTAVEQELFEICDDVLDTIQKYAIPKLESTKIEHNVFFLKMKGDYYRYKAEVLQGEMKRKMADSAKENYVSAREIADVLSATNPVRLGLYLNYSVFNYEILCNTETACKMARTAFEAAIADLDNLSEEHYKESTLIMQLLRDNLTLWSSKNEVLTNAAAS